MIIQIKNIMALILLLLVTVGFQSTPKFDDVMRLYERGEYKKAAELLTQVQTKLPADPDVKLWTGRSWLKAHDWEKAVKEMEEAVKIRPSYAQAHLWLGRAIGAQASRASFLRGFGLAKKVVKAFETARRLDPNDLDIRFDLLEYYLNAPGIVGGGEDKARAEAEAIAKIDAKMGYAARAAIYSKDKKWEEAKNELVNATKDYPHDPDTHKDLAAFLLDREDFNGALESIRKSLHLNAGSKQPRLIEAAAKIRLKSDLDSAAKTLQEMASNKLIDGDPAFEDVYYWLGECYAAKGDKAKAIEAFTTALSFNPWHEDAKKRRSKLK